MLQLLVRLSQRAENGALLLQHDALGFAIRLARLASLRLLSLRSSDAEFGTWWDCVAPLFAFCVAIVRGLCVKPSARRIESFNTAMCVVGCDQQQTPRLSVPRISADQEVRFIQSKLNIRRLNNNSNDHHYVFLSLSCCVGRLVSLGRYRRIERR